MRVSASSAPRLRVKSYDELRRLAPWTRVHCLGWAHAHPELPGTDDLEVFEEERPKLDTYRGRFDGFHAPCRPRCRRPAWSGSDNNKYSVSASAVGRPVDIHAYFAIAL